MCACACAFNDIKYLAEMVLMCFESTFIFLKFGFWEERESLSISFGRKWVCGGRVVYLLVLVLVIFEVRRVSWEFERSVQACLRAFFL